MGVITSSRPHNTNVGTDIKPKVEQDSNLSAKAVNPLVMVCCELALMIPRDQIYFICFSDIRLLVK